ncbi:MAG: hypothetical protein KDK76_05765 [Chlamydiia bacterium]|nr:hypothetical protein [Chlamydiia bacterium]
MDFANLILHFFYPTFCIHCGGSVEKKSHPLCPPCTELLDWIDHKTRCPICAGPSPCSHCRKNPKPLRPHLSLFEGVGPITDLYYEFLKTKRPHFLASLILLALSRSSFPIPDGIVPATQKLFPKKSPSYLLAASVARLLKVPLLLPNGSLQDKTLLLITPTLQATDTLLTFKRHLKTFFPEKVYSLALIDERLQ